MQLNKSLVSPQEAVRLFGKTSCETVQRAMAVYREAGRRYLNDSAAIYYALGCVWNAGRVQGIREERARRKCREAKRRTGVEPVDVVRAGGRTLPLYQTDAFFDTDEGYRLFCACSKTGDMRPYRAARQAWRTTRASEKNAFAARSREGAALMDER